MALTVFLLLKVSKKKIGALIRSLEFLSPEVALYLCKSTILPCMKYYAICCPVWAGGSSCYLELLDKLQKRITGLLVLHLLPLLNSWLVVEM